MPILEPVHDFGHAVEPDTAWSESYYFNAYDPRSDTGFFTRVGIRPNEGTMDVGMSVWLPNGELGEYRFVKEQREMVDRDLRVGDVRYELIEPMKLWRLSMDADVPVRLCRAQSVSDRCVHLSLDMTFRGLSPAIGTDGTFSPQPLNDQSAAASGTTGKGHFEQAGSWQGHLTADGKVVTWNGSLGNRDRSWGPRRWGGPSMWRWFSINIDRELHFGGIRLGTVAGDLHRGWVWDGSRATSIREWRIHTDLKSDGVTHDRTHLVAVDKSGRSYELTGDVLRVADIGRTGTIVNEGLTQWTYHDPDGRERIGSGIAEYLHQLDDAGRPIVPVE